MNGKALSLFVLLLIHGGAAFTIPLEIHAAGDYILRQEYDSAAAQLQGLPRRDSLYGDLYIRNSRVVDYESYTPAGGAVITRAQTLISEISQDKKKNGRDTFYLAAAYGIRGLQRIKRGKELKGSLDTKKSTALFSNLRKAGFTYTPVLEPIYLYDYYSAKMFGWVPFRDSPGDALARLNRLAQRGDIFSHFTRQSLFWIHYERSNYSHALTVLRSSRDAYPQNTLMLRAAANGYFKKGDYDKARKTADQLFRTARQRSPRNLSDMLSAGRIRAGTALKTGDTTEARRIISACLALQPTDFESRIDWVQKHQTELEQLNESF
ncbi:MAG: tetratricopeptide repeat protein [Fibrobacterota bacterium]